MAEIALRGIQIAIRSTRASDQPCAHVTTLSTLSSGIERKVCETCGHLSVHFHTAIRGPIDRERFARPADEGQIASRDVDQLLAGLAALGDDEEDVTGDSPVFAQQPRLRIRRRERRVLTHAG